MTEPALLTNSRDEPNVGEQISAELGSADQVDVLMAFVKFAGINTIKEQLQQLGPVVQRLQFEFLRKIIERVYNILDRAGILPQPEDAELALALSNEEVTIEYISPLAQAQKMAGMTNIEQAIAFTGQLAQFDQSVLDKIDFAKTIDSYFDMVGAPASIKRTEEEYEAIQQQKAQAMAEAKQQEQMAQAVQMAAPAAQAAKNITEAANDGNPALQEWLGGMM